MRAATSKKTNFRERQGRPALLHIIPRLPPEQARNVLKLSARRMDSLRSSPSPGAWSATSIRRQKKTNDARETPLSPFFQDALGSAEGFADEQGSALLPLVARGERATERRRARARRARRSESRT